MGVDVEEDLKRKMVEINIAAGRTAQSPQTGYIHLHYESDERHDTIPLLENFCFCLALLRSRLTDHILEGEALLEKLLAFEVDGNFPLYLHEFPQCKDRSLGLSLLPIFHWILADFRIALGEGLTLHIEALIGRILSHGYKMHAQRPLSKSAEFRLKSYVEPNDLPIWTPSTPEEWADALISTQIAPSNDDTLLEEALQKWHPQLCTYIGPQQYDRGEPKVTLFDLILGHSHGLYSRRSLEDRRVHLLASLVHPFEKKNTALVESPFHAISASSHPYALYWGTPDKLHSFLLAPYKSQVSIEKSSHAIEFTITLPPQAPQPGEDAFELAFFINIDPSHTIWVCGAKATTFRLGDLIELRSLSLHLHLELSLEMGDGRFFGHISRANRPTQKGKNLKYETYDWQIALRTIRRTEDCRLKVRLSI